MLLEHKNVVVMEGEGKIYIAESKNGKGVFARTKIVKDEKIMEFRGETMKKIELPSPYTEVKDLYVQIGKDLYMGPSGGADDFVNHSCDPNVALTIDGNQVVLAAIKDIREGEEITWDYSTTMDEDEWEKDCMCDSRTCRRRIRDFKHLPESVRGTYCAIGIVPEYNHIYCL